MNDITLEESLTTFVANQIGLPQKGTDGFLWSKPYSDLWSMQALQLFVKARQESKFYLALISLPVIDKFSCTSNYDWP